MALGQFQEDVLHAVQTLAEGAYGMNIRNFLEKNSKKTIHMPQVYAALSRLESLGFVESQLDRKGSAGQRGRTRRNYKVNAHGLQMLNRRVRVFHSAGAKESYTYEDETAATTA